MENEKENGNNHVLTEETWNSVLKMMAKVGPKLIELSLAKTNIDTLREEIGALTSQRNEEIARRLSTSEIAKRLDEEIQALHISGAVAIGEVANAMRLMEKWKEMARQSLQSVETLGDELKKRQETIDRLTTELRSKQTEISEHVGPRRIENGKKA